MKNSTIYRNPENQKLFDFSSLGTLIHENESIQIAQVNHYFQVGDVLYYNVKEHLFEKSIAKNNIVSESCGVVSEVIDIDNFVMISMGEIKTSRYSFDINTPLYLSDTHAGKLTSIAPSDIVKQIATKSANGIIVDIQRGYKASETTETGELEPYTKEELDEIIKNIW